MFPAHFKSSMQQLTYILQSITTKKTLNQCLSQHTCSLPILPLEGEGPGAGTVVFSGEDTGAGDSLAAGDFYN